MDRRLLAVVAALALVGCVGRSPAGGGRGGDDDDAIGGGGPGGGGGGGGGGGEGGFVPAELVGEWYAGRGGTSVPYDPTTGSWGMPSGEGLLYLFEADGSYTKAFQSYNSNGGCTNGFTAFESGRLSVDGAMLTTSPSSGHLKVDDTCAPSLNSDDPLDGLEDETFTWELRPNEYDPTTTELWLQRLDGAEATFRPL